MHRMSIDEQRAELRQTRPRAGRRHRILFIGRYAQGPTDIVASLKRALENLGHTVFHVDTNRHKKVLDNSSGARGGYGPIYLKLDEIRPILDRFRPQVMVLCAGGLVLDEASAAECRERGIVLVGMTLSDPDVQPSVIDHVGRFDYHTTNAALALERYEQAGVRNTMLLPFGIDRDFVLRTVDPDPALRADVICIGHAPGRTDRHEVMGALVDKFNVRVYGSGWPFPGAAPVSGDRLLQAAAAGTFHVNFPATRAGFTNVKCGVFESIAAGGVLCTQVFDEMAGLFDYDTEIVGYRDPDDLAERIKELLDDPSRLEDVRRNAFRRLISEHLYEHRWQALFESIMADLDAESPRVGAERAGQIREILAQEAPQPRTILVSGYYGAQNRGDDLLLEALTRPIEEKLPDARIVVAAVEPAQVELTHGLQAFRRIDHLSADYWASRAAAVVLGPGGLWHDYTIKRAGGTAGIVTGAEVSPAHLVQLPALTVAHGGDFHVFGMGVGPLTDDAAKAAVRLSGHLASTVVVRDSTSRELLEQIPGFGAEVVQAPDIVYAADLPKPEDGGERGYLAVNLRPWDFGEVGLSEIRDAVLEVATERGLDIVGVPMQPVDALAIEAAFGDRDLPVGFTMVPCDSPLEDFVQTLSGAAAVVAMRLHTSLVAHRLGRPVVGLAYDPKVHEHYVEVGRGDYVLGLPVDQVKLDDALRRALEQQSVGDASAERIQQLESAALAAVAGLADQLGAAPVHEAPAGVIAQEPEQKTVNPFGWRAEEVIDLASGELTSGNLHDPERSVEFESILGKRQGLRLSFAASAPRQGDYISWKVHLPDSRHKGVRVELLLRNKYKEAWSKRGRIAYEVHVDGEPLLRQDVATWQPRNSVWIAKPASSEGMQLEVRVVALRDCEDWNWGPEARVALEGARARAWPGGKFVWSASSPRIEALRDRLTPGHGRPANGSIPRRLGRRARKVIGR